MPGWQNAIGYAKNFDFSGAAIPAESQGLATNGQMWIGTTAVNAGGTHINVGGITSPNGTLTVGYSSPNITLDLAGGTLGIDSIGVDATSGGGTNPVLPTAAGLVTTNGARVAAGTNPVRTVSTAANVYQVQVQTAQAIAATDATKVGLANFNSAQFSVDANGFVSVSATGVATTITGDSGGALSPSSNNWNILGGPGVTTSGSGSTLTINSVVFTNTTATTLAVDNGYFATAAGTYNLPASAAQGEVIEIVVDVAGVVVLDAPASNFIKIGNALTSSGGTATSSGLSGDALKLRYRASSLTWESISVIGNWITA